MAIEKRSDMYTCDICGKKEESQRMPARWFDVAVCRRFEITENVIEWKVTYDHQNIHLACNECLFGLKWSDSSVKEAQLKILKYLFSLLKGGK